MTIESFTGSGYLRKIGKTVVQTDRIFRLNKSQNDVSNPFLSIKMQIEKKSDTLSPDTNKQFHENQIINCICVAEQRFVGAGF
jgi:hypothetical protein